MTFEEQLMQSMQQKILKEIKSTNFIQIEYGQRQRIPDKLIEQVWQSIKWDEVIEQIRPTIQTKICNSIVGAMETETKTDVKKLLSVDGVRQKLRMEVYPKLMQVLDEK